MLDITLHSFIAWTIFIVTWGVTFIHCVDYFPCYLGCNNCLSVRACVGVNRGAPPRVNQHAPVENLPSLTWRVYVTQSLVT